MSDQVHRYRLKQGGLVVASAEGADALREVCRYARMYADEGPVTIERHSGRKWVTWAELMKGRGIE